MALVTTHTEGRIVTHSGDDAGPIDVVQLPNRDAAVQAATADSPTTNGQVDGRRDEPDAPPAGAAMRVKPKPKAKAPAKKR